VLTLDADVILTTAAPLRAVGWDATTPGYAVRPVCFDIRHTPTRTYVGSIVDLDALGSIHAICQLKYAYFRFLDLKRFGELGALLTDDATTAYQSGELCQNGRDEIVAFLEQSLGDPGIVTQHNGHHPEISLAGDTATGTWYLEDRVIVPEHDFELRGTALYSDRYGHVGGTWKIAHTGYQRLYEERLRYSSGQVLSIGAGGRTIHFSS
jgi:hypothetical protein